MNIGDAMGTYALGQLGWYVLAAVFNFLFLLFGCWVMAGYCAQCGRKKQWRWRKPTVYASRSHCVFCED